MSPVQVGCHGRHPSRPHPRMKMDDSLGNTSQGETQETLERRAAEVRFREFQRKKRALEEANRLLEQELKRVEVCPRIHDCFALLDLISFFLSFSFFIPCALGSWKGRSWIVRLKFNDPNSSSRSSSARTVRNLLRILDSFSLPPTPSLGFPFLSGTQAGK